MHDIAGVMLAAGKGTRIGGSLPKVLNPVAGKPMIAYSLALLKSIPLEEIYTVVGYKAQDVIANIGGKTHVVEQGEALGTAHAVHQALNAFNPTLKHALVVNGDDSAFYEVSTLRALIKQHLESNSVVSFLTLKRANPAGLGRIIRNDKGEVKSIVEDKDATTDEKKIKEVNIGCYLFSIAWLKQNIDKVQKSASGEYYITDLIGMAIEQQSSVTTVTLNDESEWMGVNTLDELAKADAAMIARMKEWKKPKVFFFDIDHTLLNTDGLREAFTSVFEKMVSFDLGLTESAEELSKKFWKLYGELNQSAGFVSIPSVCLEFARAIDKPEAEALLKSLFLSLPFAQYLYPDAVELLESCSRWGTVVIISNGDNVYQPAKIDALGIDQYVSDRFVYQIKLDHMEEFFGMYKDYEVWSINDNIQEQEAFEKYSPATHTIWIKQGKYKNLKPLLPTYKPAYFVTSLKEVRDILHTKFAK